MSPYRLTHEAPKLQTVCREFLRWRSAFIVLLCLSIASAYAPTTVAAQELSELVREGNFEQLRMEVNGGSWSQRSLDEALIAAAGLNRPDAAFLLLSNGANPNESFLGQSSAVIAVREGSADALQILLDGGADPNWLSNFDWRPLHHAIGETWSFDDIIEILVLNGAKIDAVTNLQVTTLHRAAGFCQGTAVRMLLALGANKDLVDKYGQTAAMRARKSNCSDVAEMLD